MAFEVPIDTKKMDALTASFEKGTEAANKLADAVDKVNQRADETRTVSGRLVQAPANPSDASSPSFVRTASYGPRNPSRPWTGGGPRQALEREQEALRQAEGFGENDLTRDQRNKVLSAQKRVDRADRALDGTGKSRDELLADLISTSRVLPGGRLSPLVGKLAAFQTADGSQAAAGTLKALGIGEGRDLAPMIASAAKAALPAIIAGGATMAAGAAVVALAETGDAKIRKANDAFYAMGGSSSGVGAAMALGGENAAAKAMVLGDRLRQGSFGSAYLHSQGIYDMGPMQTDKSSNYVRSIDALRRIKDDQTAIRVARDTGLTDDLWTRDIKSDGLYNTYKASFGDAGSPEDRASEARYRAQKGIVGNTWDRVHKWFGRQAMDYLSDPTGLLNDAELMGGDRKQGAQVRKSGLKWQNVDPAIGDSPNTVNGTTAGAIPVGYRGRALNADLDKMNAMIGAF